MRVTGGSDRGRKLRAPRGRSTRPTASRVREAIFNILGPAPGDPVLDLFAGTGALGIEAMSRGAPSACFVERDGRALMALAKNLREMGFAQRSEIVGTNVRTGLQRLVGRQAGETPGAQKQHTQKQQRFGWVFVDPPYAAGETDDVLGILGGGELLAEHAVVVVEHDKRHMPPEAAGSLRRTDCRFYGDTGVSFYRRNAGAGHG